MAEAEGSADLAVKAAGNYVPGYLIKAKVQIERGHGAPGMATLREALQQDRGNVVVRGLAAQASLMKGQTEPARSHVEAALKADPTCPEALFAARLLHELTGTPREAQAAWDRYLDADPGVRRARTVARGLLVVQRVALSTTTGPVYGWTPDGAHVLSVPQDDRGTVQLLAPDGSDAAKALKTAVPVVWGGAALPSDGKWLAYFAPDKDTQTRRLYV